MPPQDINPYAVGHIINHPPPDFSANVKLIDFDLPFSFFPSAYARYIPYLNYRSRVPGSHAHRSVTRNETAYRAVALVATETLSHGDELYLDYLSEQRVCSEAIQNAPDWLLTPAPQSSHLKKREMIAEIPYPVQLLMSYEEYQMGRRG